MKAATLLWFWLHTYNSCHLLERACCIQEPKIGALKQHLRNQNGTLWKGGLVLESIMLMPRCTPFILLKSQIADAAFTMYKYNYKINAWRAIVISTKSNSPNQKNAFRPLKRMCTVLWRHSTMGLQWKKNNCNLLWPPLFLIWLNMKAQTWPQSESCFANCSRWVGETHS